MKTISFFFGDGRYVQDRPTDLLNIMKLLQEQSKVFKNSPLFLNLVLINLKLKQILKIKILK
jgi:hypothetical protein